MLSYWMLVAIPGAIAIARPSLTGATVLAVAGVYLGLFVLTSEWIAVGKYRIQESRSLE